jgi:hypothetical protein
MALAFSSDTQHPLRTQNDVSNPARWCSLLPDGQRTGSRSLFPVIIPDEVAAGNTGRPQLP